MTTKPGDTIPPLNRVQPMYPALVALMPGGLGGLQLVASCERCQHTALTAVDKLEHMPIYRRMCAHCWWDENDELRAALRSE